MDVGSKLKTKPLNNISGPEMDMNLFSHQVKPKTEKKEKSKISAKTEWPLIIFTLLSAGLVGTYISGITKAFTLIEKHIFIGAAITSAILSILHLGKKLRAWRSLINLKNSWLSREILFFMSFILALVIDFYLFDIPGIVVSTFGLLLLFSIDMLYGLATWKWPAKIHSAQTLFIGITIFTLLINQPEIFYMIIFFRLLLYFYRKIKYHQIIKLTSFFRIILALASVFLLSKGFSIFHILTPLVLGEIIDRIEFYNELNVPEPRNEIN